MFFLLYGVLLCTLVCVAILQSRHTSLVPLAEQAKLSGGSMAFWEDVWDWINRDHLEAYQDRMHTASSIVQGPEGEHVQIGDTVYDIGRVRMGDTDDYDDWMDGLQYSDINKDTNKRGGASRRYGEFAQEVYASHMVRNFPLNIWTYAEDNIVLRNRSGRVTDTYGAEFWFNNKSNLRTFKVQINYKGYDVHVPHADIFSFTQTNNGKFLRVFAFNMDGCRFTLRYFYIFTIPEQNKQETGFLSFDLKFNAGDRQIRIENPESTNSAVTVDIKSKDKWVLGSEYYNKAMESIAMCLFTRDYTSFLVKVPILVDLNILAKDYTDHKIDVTFNPLISVFEDFKESVGMHGIATLTGTNKTVRVV